MKALCEYLIVKDDDGLFWIDVSVDRVPHDSVGPFTSRAECKRAYDDLLQMMRECGAVDLPSRPQ